MESDTHVTLTRAQVREVDRRAIEDYGIPGIVLMENAGRRAAEAILQLGPSKEGVIAIVCGPGNNGGDGFVIARHLHNAGLRVELFLACDPEKLTGDASVNHCIIERMGLPRRRFATAEDIATNAPALRGAGVIVDAILGTGFSGDVRPPLYAAIEAINSARAQPRVPSPQASGLKRQSLTQHPRQGPQAPLVIAIDLPSGLDCDSGRACSATVRADHTITFVARKAGFTSPGSMDYTGIVHVRGIGAPRDLVDVVARLVR